MNKALVETKKAERISFAATKNQLSISIGDPGITADSIVEIPTPSQVVLGFV